MQNKWTVSLLSKKEVVPGVLELIFSYPENFTFLAGQFVQFLIPGLEEETKRAYSIASVPNGDNLIFAVRLIENGKASTYFKNANIGDEIEFVGPYGNFITTDKTADRFHVAAGVGSTPIFSLIEDDLYNKKTKNNIFLLLGFRLEEDIFWFEKLEKFKKEHSNFDYKITLTSPTENWSGAVGRVTTHLNGVDAEKDIFVCGAVEMVKDVQTYLLTKKIPISKIHFEVF